MPLFRSISISPRQQRLNRVAVIVLCLAGINLGLWEAYRCAKIPIGYIASYSGIAAIALTANLCALGLLLLIYWRTRWFGIGLIAAGLLSYAGFYGGLFVLLKMDRVAWRHEQLVHFGPDVKASAVIYFRSEITEEDAGAFASAVLSEPAQMPGSVAPPRFVREYLRLTPWQANGHWGIALTFAPNAPPNEVSAYLEKIKADRRVETVYLDTAPTAIRVAEPYPPHRRPAPPRSRLSHSAR